MNNPEKECSIDLSVMAREPVMVPPNSKPSSDTILYLSNIDNQSELRMAFNVLLLYNRCPRNSTDPAKLIREALPKVSDDYYPLAGRLIKAGDGKLELECDGGGAVFVEATTHLPVSSLGELRVLTPSLQQLLFQFRPSGDVHDIRPLIIQVTRFGCGGFVVGASLYHSLCDGRGAVQFLNGLAEICRRNVGLSVKPVWHREALLPRNPPRVEFRHVELIHDGAAGPPFAELEEVVELEQASFILGCDPLERIKQGILQQSAAGCTSFEALAALAWRARTKALQIRSTQTVKLIFAVDVRSVLISSLPRGYYGNAFLGASVLAPAREVLHEPLVHVIKMIQRAKMSLLNEAYVRSAIGFLEIHRSLKPATVRVPAEILYISDWTRLGFDEVDFGWGDAANACPVTWKGLAHANVFLFIRPPKCQEGVKMLACLPKSAMKSFLMEMQELSQHFGKEHDIGSGDTMPV